MSLALTRSTTGAILTSPTVLDRNRDRMCVHSWHPIPYLLHLVLVVLRAEFLDKLSKLCCPCPRDPVLLEWLETVYNSNLLHRGHDVVCNEVLLENPSHSRPLLAPIPFTPRQRRPHDPHPAWCVQRWTKIVGPTMYYFSSYITHTVVSGQTIPLFSDEIKHETLIPHVTRRIYFSVTFLQKVEKRTRNTK